MWRRISAAAGGHDDPAFHDGYLYITEAGNDGVDNDGDTVVDEDDEDWANGRARNCSMTIISENDIRFGCVTLGATPLGHPQVAGLIGATINVKPEADLAFRIRPGKDNGVVRRLLDENCEVADIFGDIFPNTNAGLTPDCTDVDIVQCVKAVSRGQHYTCPTMTTYLVQKARRVERFAHETPGLKQLTRQERTILAWIAREKTSKEIAVELGIAPKTVDTHRANICRKLEIHGNHALTRFAMRHRSEL